MARREDFDNSLWSDPDFLALSPEAKLTYIWTWTNSRCGMAGIYKLALSQPASETGYTEEQIAAAFAELADARFAFYQDKVLWVRTRVKHLRQKTQQIAKSIANDLRRVADSHPLKAQFIESYSHHIWLKDHICGEGQVSLDRPTREGADPRDGHSTVLGTGTGIGIGRGSRNTRAGTRGADASYRPTVDMVAMRDSHFPGVEVGTVESAVFVLRQRRCEVTPEAIAELLRSDEGLAA